MGRSFYLVLLCLALLLLGLLLGGLVPLLAGGLPLAGRAGRPSSCLLFLLFCLRTLTESNKKSYDS